MENLTYTRDLIRHGRSADEIARMVRAGELTRVRRGAFVMGAGSTASGTRPTHLRLVRATVAQCPSELVVSHMSAAVVHGLPLWSAGLDRVHFTASRRGGGKSRRLVKVHGSPLEADEIAVVDGLVVTSLARTVLDLACELPMQSAVAVGDAALRLGVTRADLDSLVERAGPRNGIGAARRAIAFLDRRSGSVGESRSRVLLHANGFPKPELQFEIVDREGWVFAHGDFGWEELRTVGEFDGKTKYRRDLRPGHDPERELFDEKLREDRIRDLDLQVVRWVSADLERPAGWFDRLRRAFERGRRHL